MEPSKGKKHKQIKRSAQRQHESGDSSSQPDSHRTTGESGVKSKRSAWGSEKPHVNPSPSHKNSPMRTSRSQGEPSQQSSSEPSGRRKKQPQGKSPQQSSSEPSGWGKKQPQGEPSQQSSSKPSGQGKKQPQGQPPQQSSSEPSVWGKKQPQGQPPQQSSSEPSVWGKKQPQEPHSRQLPKIPLKSPDIENISQALSLISTQQTEKQPEYNTFARRIYAQKKSGRPITVCTNFFRLIIENTNLVVYDYDVKIEPDKPKNMIREVWNKFCAREFPGRLTAFNGKNAYANGPLMQGTRHSGTITLQVSDTNKEKEFKVEVQEVRRVSFQCFDNYRERMGRDSSMKVLPESETTILDIILRNWACDNFVRSGRSFFTPLSKNPKQIQLSKKLIMRNGYYEAAFLGYELYVNFDLAHKAFYAPLHLLDLVENFRSGRYFNGAEMDQFIRGMKIEYQLPNDPSSRKTYSVNGLVRDANSQTFKKDDGTEVSVVQYFSKEKNIRLRHPDLPLLWVGSRQKNIYLPLEFCRITPDQIYKGQVDPMETREMVRHATADARTRKNDLYKLFDETDINRQPLMREFGLRVSTEMERVEGRVLEPPRLKTTCPVRVNDGIWRIKDFLEPRELNNWCILKLDNRAPRDKIYNLQNILKDRGRSFNMRISDPARNIMDLEPNLRDMERTFNELGNMDLVIVIVPDMKGVYANVKTICETRAKVLTQCIKTRTISQDPRKIFTTIDNILLKVNAKLGGINHTLDKSSIPDCMKGKVMIVGADVTHPSPGMKTPSVAAVAVSCDEAAFKYSTTTRVQPKGEIIVDLQEIITKHVKEFYNLRKSYPEKIIFFRDGVSEGELAKVYHSELGAVRRACQKFCQPKITFLVVQKRHHTRFYPESQRDEFGKNLNVPPGTCIDSKVIHPRDMDFYLVSHASILGTARPTRYRLLHDDNELTDDEVERLSYYLCHLFSRCNRSVSYPSPTYNAHLAAFRVRAYLEGYRGQAGKDSIADIQKYVSESISEKSPMFFV